VTVGGSGRAIDAIDRHDFPTPPPVQNPHGLPEKPTGLRLF
jgi:hypothetical protein